MLLRRPVVALYGLGLGLGLGLGGQAYANRMPQTKGTANVTGGSRGIGAACSKKLGDQGWDVVVVYRSGESAAQEVVTSITANGARACAIQCDVSEEEQVVKLFDAVDGWRGSSPLTALIKTRLPVRELLQDLSEKTLMEVLKTNTIGPALCIREAEAHGHCPWRFGVIVQVSSGSACWQPAVASPRAANC